MLEKVELSCVPSPLTTAMIAMEIPAAISPYSMAVAAPSSLMKLRNAHDSLPHSKVAPRGDNRQVVSIELLNGSAERASPWAAVENWVIEA
jgi:hypothetical protein